MDHIKLLEVVTDGAIADRTSKSLHPSALRGCDRKALLSALEYKKTHPMDTKLKWKLNRFGTYEGLFKRGFEALAAKHTLDVREQLELRLGSFHGYVDFALLGQNENIYIEVKSSAPSAFSKGSMPYPAHVAQAQAYYIMAHESDAPDKPTQVLLLYVSRWYEGKMPIFRTYDVTPSDEEYEEMLSYMGVLEEYKRNEALPTVPFSHSEEHPFLCRRKNWKKKDSEGNPETEVSCEYYSHCWAAELPL